MAISAVKNARMAPPVAAILLKEPGYLPACSSWYPLKTNNAGRPLMVKPFLSCGNLNPHTAWQWQAKQTLLYGQRSVC